MAKKPRKHLATDLKLKDVILLDRPEVEILDIKPAKKKYRASPKGSLVVEIEDKATGKLDEIFLLSDDRIDVVKRLSWWDKFKNYLDRNHREHVEKVSEIRKGKTVSKDDLPPLFK